MICRYWSIYIVSQISCWDLESWYLAGLHLYIELKVTYMISTWECIVAKFEISFSWSTVSSSDSSIVLWHINVSSISFELFEISLVSAAFLKHIGCYDVFYVNGIKCLENLWDWLYILKTVLTTFYHFKHGLVYFVEYNDVLNCIWCDTRYFSAEVHLRTHSEPFFCVCREMSELQAVLDCQVELSKFYNIDLFQRGLALPELRYWITNPFIRNLGKECSWHILCKICMVQHWKPSCLTFAYSHCFGLVCYWLHALLVAYDLYDADNWMEIV